MTFTHSKLAALIEFLAIKHIDVQHSNNAKHFAKSEIETIIAGNAPSGLKSPAVILEESEGRVIADSRESASKSRLCAFHILKAHKSITDTITLERIKDECELIGDQFIALILDIAINKYDYLDDSGEMLFPWIQEVSASSIRIQRVEGAFGHWHGIRVQMEISGESKINREDAKWDL